MRLFLGLVRTLHAWSGAALSLLLIVLGLTGALLVWSPDFLRLTIPEARQAASATPQALGAVAEAAEHAFGHPPKYMVFARPGQGLHQVFLHDEHFAYLAGDGHTVTTWQGAGRPEVWVYNLHHFLLAGETGMKVVGFAGLAALALILTGLIVWAPVWRASRLRVWPKSPRRPDLLATHRNIGLIFAIPVFAFCLTGSAMIFYQTAQKWLVKALPGPEAEEFFPPADEGDMDWPKALAAAQGAFPGARLRVIIWPSFPGARAQILMQQPAEWNPEGKTKVVINPRNSEILGVVDPQALARGTRLFDAFYPIHTATVGGRLYDVAATLCGLAMAGLGALGLWSFLIKPRRRKAGGKGAGSPA